MQIDDQTLMALADGEIEPERASALRRAVEADPDLQARLHRFQETRRLLSALRMTPATEDPLAAMIRNAAQGVTPGRGAPPPPTPDAAPPPAQPGVAGTLRAPKRAAQPANLNRRPWFAAAASVAVVALGLGWWQWAGTPQPPGLSGAELAALDSLPSGEVHPLEGGGEIAMIASFRLPDGALCREFETAGGGALRTVLACRDGGSWSQRLAFGHDPQGQDYRPASGSGTIEDALAALGATTPLTPEDEAQALRNAP